jgi:hypothetical protein
VSTDAASDVPVLKEPQRRHYEVVLASLQRALADIEALTDAHETDETGQLTVFDRDLPADFSGRIRFALRSARGRIAQIVQLLNITPRHRSRAAAIRAAITSAMLRLEDSHSYKMRGYGMVDGSVATHLDPLIDELIADFRAMQQVSDAARHAGRARRENEER